MEQETQITTRSMTQAVVIIVAAAVAVSNCLAYSASAVII